MDSKIILYLFFGLLVSLKSFAAEFQGKFIQGHFIIGKTNPGTKILIDKREVKVSGLEGMSREELENKLKELSNKIDGYNAKTIEAEAVETKKIENV